MFGESEGFDQYQPRLSAALIRKSIHILWLLKYIYHNDVEITPCNKIDKPLVVYRFSGNVMTGKPRILSNFLNSIN